MPSLNDTIQDHVVHHSAVDLMRVEAGIRKRILRDLKKLQVSLVKQLTTANLEGPGPGMTARKMARLQALLKQTTKTIASAYTGVDDYMEKSLKDLALAESKWVNSSMTASMGTSISTVALSKSRLEELSTKSIIDGKFPKQWWQKGGKEYAHRFETEIRQAMLRGETIGEMVKRIQKIVPTVRRNAEAQARTSVQTVLQAARRESYKQYEDILKGYKYSSTLDDRTTPYCQAADGTIFDLDYKVVDGPKWVEPPPNHWNCFIDPQIPIYTDKGWVPIVDIKKGDMVLTHRGRFRKVTEILRQYDQLPELCTLRLSIPGGCVITATKGHPVAIETLRGMEWVQISKVKPGDSVSFLAPSPIHVGDFYFTTAKVKSTFSTTSLKRKTLYNFSVEEDESYIAKGFVVHNCRSTITPITKSWAELSKQYKGKKIPKKIDAIPSKTRAAMDGKAPRDINYTDWLKEKSSEFQDDVLGKPRAKMFRAGKITHLAQLLDQSGNSLTIKNLLIAIDAGTLIDPITGVLLASSTPGKGTTVVKAGIDKPQSTKTKTPQEAPVRGATPEEIRKVEDSRQNGYTLRTDIDEIEDLEVLVYPEKDIKGNDLTSAMFKVRNRGILKMNKAAKAAETGKKDQHGVLWTKKKGSFEEKKIDKGNAVRTGKHIDLYEFEDDKRYTYDYFEGVKGDTVIRYWKDPKDTAFQGRVEITVKGKPVTGIDEIYDIMDDFGLNTRRATPEYQEELYLKQLMYQQNDSKKYDKIIKQADEIGDRELRLEYLKQQYDEWVGGGLSKKPTDSPDYNPLGETQVFDQGRRFNKRPDLELDPDWADFKKDYVLAHEFYGDIVDDLKNILNSGGQMAPTTDKLRRGIPWGGQSPVADIDTGGASYLFTRLGKRGNFSRENKIIWKADVLKRTDSISYPHDIFGDISKDVLENNRTATIEGFRNSALGDSRNETLFKNSLSIFEDVEAIIVPANRLEEVREMFRKALKSNNFPDGTPIEKVIVSK